MKNSYTSMGIALRIWGITGLLFAMGFVFVLVYNEGRVDFHMLPVVFVVTMLGSLPALIVMFLGIPIINYRIIKWQNKFFILLFIQFLVTVGYGCTYGILETGMRADFFSEALSACSLLFTCSASATFLILQKAASYFSGNQTAGSSYSLAFNSLFQHTLKIKTTMETFYPEQQTSNQPAQQDQPNKVMIKGIITGVLILLMLIPTIFINNIITEREKRQKDVVKEVSSKWATAQTISGPYLAIPYTDTAGVNGGNLVLAKKHLIVLANDLNVKGQLFPEERPRSIYKVLLYKSQLAISGSFKPVWPANINPSSLDFANAKLCFGITDFKGIEEEIHIEINKQRLTFSPGLPVQEFGRSGLSVPVSLTPEGLNAGIAFSMSAKLRGSEQLHFIPLSANSKFSVNSTWPNPSFDGNTLPNERQVSSKGFVAKWNFSQANLPFGTVLKEGGTSIADLSFGVSMVQPADQYNKTTRSIKYAILFIGLTFALFFIIEIMQRKPFHPVQYVLVGLALVIFYSLLLSISEYLLFDLSYLIASAATVLLISLYAKSHFRSWPTAGIFFLTLSLLYGFIFILIRLEDTSLLVGSVGLFIVLAAIMYASRKVNWYGK